MLRSHFRAELVLILVTILAAFGWIFSKETLAGLPPLLFMGVRFLVAGFILLLAGRKYFVGLRFSDIKNAILVGLVMGVAMMLWIVGLDHSTQLGVGAFITSLGVILVPIMAKLLFGDRPGLPVWLSLPVAVIGLGLLALNDGLAFELSHLYFLVAAVTFALQFNLLSRSSTRMHVLVLTSIQLISAGSLAFILSLFLETWPEVVSLPVFGWFLASTLIATSLRFLLQTYGMSLTPASHAAVIMNLEPMWTAVFASFWFMETMALTQIVGCSLIFIAMLISKWTQIRAVFTAS